MSSKSETVQKATIGIALLVLASKIIGFLREAIIAYRFGTGAEYDVYLIAISIPTALYALFNYSMSNIFIPNYSHAKQVDDSQTALGKVWSEFTLSVILAIVATITIIILAPQIIRAIAPGMQEIHLGEAVLITRVSSVLIILAAMESFFRSILNAEKKFYLPAAGPIFANSIIILAILLFSDKLSTRAILYGLVTGYFVQMLVNYLPYRALNIAKRISTKLSLDGLGRFFLPAVAVLIVEGSAQAYSIIDRYFASGMEYGIISALGYSYILIQLPASIFAFALSTALFPYMSDAFAGNNNKESGHLLARGIDASLLIAIPSMILFWVFSNQIVTIFYHRGAFNLDSVTFTAIIFKWQALGLAGHFLLWILTRAYYAARKLRILLIQVVLAVVAKIFLAYILIEHYGFVGLAISGSITFALAAIILLAGIPIGLARLDVRGTLLYLIKLIAAGAAMYLVAQTTADYFTRGIVDFWPLLGWLSLAAAGSLAVFILIGYGLRLGVLKEVLQLKR